MTALKKISKQKQSCLEELIMKLKVTFIFLELLLEYLGELKTKH